jgi:hypothetical protein
MRVFVEAGDKKVFAGTIDWPGLARSAKTEPDALERLFEYLPRYKASLGVTARDLELPADAAALVVAARLRGGSGTDFGVPSVVADFDREALGTDDLRQQVELLRAAWRAFESAAERARGKPLATGPRGGGRSREKIVDHVIEADLAYIAALGAKPPRDAGELEHVQAALVEALGAKIRGELPEVGPRGGERWPARYAIRRSAWHALDHAWELEDRVSIQP